MTVVPKWFGCGIGLEISGWCNAKSTFGANKSTFGANKSTFGAKKHRDNQN